MSDYIHPLPIVFLVCVIAIVILALRHRAATGAWPEELTSDDNVPLRNKLFSWIVVSSIMLRTLLPESFQDSVRGALVFAGLDLSLFLGFSFVAVYLILQSFHSGWSRDVWFHQAYLLIFMIVLGFFVGQDVVAYLPIPWIWIIAALEACLFTPLFARLAYHQLDERYDYREQGIGNRE